MPIIREPEIDDRPEKPYLGIRTQTPFRGMFAVVDKLRKELFTWVKQQGVEPAEPHFLRYHVIDMAGEMDIELGILVKPGQPGDERVCPGVLPAGRYASLIYTRGGMTGNKTLIEWARANGIAWDRWADEKGDAFHCRCETYLADPKTQPRKSEWEVEVAIKLAEDQSKEKEL